MILNKIDIIILSHLVANSLSKCRRWAKSMSGTLPSCSGHMELRLNMLTDCQPSILPKMFLLIRSLSIGVLLLPAMMRRSNVRMPFLHWVMLTRDSQTCRPVKRKMQDSSVIYQVIVVTCGSYSSALPQRYLFNASTLRSCAHQWGAPAS